MWASGSWAVEVPGIEPSLKVLSHAVGLPPDVSRKTTVNGAVPVRDEGALTALPVKAAFGALPTGMVGPDAVMPVLTGKVDAADTRMVPPTMLEMTGVMTP